MSGDPASGWTDYSTKTNILYPMAGYAANLGPNDIPNTIDVTGIVNNGNVSITLYNNNNPFTQGFNLVGNPYPSPIDWDAISGWTKSILTMLFISSVQQMSMTEYIALISMEFPVMTIWLQILSLPCRDSSYMYQMVLFP